MRMSLFYIILSFLANKCRLGWSSQTPEATSARIAANRDAPLFKGGIRSKKTDG
jgi:hypothetical protein